MMDECNSFTTSSTTSPPPFPVTANDLSNLVEEHTPWAWATILTPLLHPTVTLPEKLEIEALVDRLRGVQLQQNNQDIHTAAKILTTFILLSNCENGLPGSTEDLEDRERHFGANVISGKKYNTFFQLCLQAANDLVLILLVMMGIVIILVELFLAEDDHHQDCDLTNGACFLESISLFMAVLIVILVSATINYRKQLDFANLSKKLEEMNIKQVIRDGTIYSIPDSEIVVGDILLANSHALETIPADCVLLNSVSSHEFAVNESSLTGESDMVYKKPGDIVLSGTRVAQGSGNMVVIAVGTHSVAGKIKARVYASSEDEFEEGEDSPLFTKLDTLAEDIGKFGTVAAFISFISCAIIGFGVYQEAFVHVTEYFITAVTVLAVAVPEGLPLAVTLALAYSSNQMVNDMCLVKNLNACETMGCATTICTDKTGTLTKNKMTVRALFIGNQNFIATDPTKTLASIIQTSVEKTAEEILDLLSKVIAIDTMDESFLDFDENYTVVTKTHGNPTECALLHFIFDLGRNYQQIRLNTRGRAITGDLSQYIKEGKRIDFTSDRKLMSWAVPSGDGFRVYCKGATEVLLSRCTQYLTDIGEVQPFEEKEARNTIQKTIEQYSRRGMRCLVLAYREFSENNIDETHPKLKNPDGSPALKIETDLIFLAAVGIEDPIRPEVPSAVVKCYGAGIDIRMVTGDDPHTAVSIALQAGILKPYHFLDHVIVREEMNLYNLKPNVLLEGKAFRELVYRNSSTGEKEFDQDSFDEVWPQLRIIARSSPDDKLTLAHGLNKSELFQNKIKVEELKHKHNISIYPDRQVVAMTGDGSNDASALKRADVGFAMGITGTQIAKDAADIVLLDDNFASIVNAAKWGRNIYASIQKFVQFQLTVNVSAVITSLVGSFAYQQSPLAAIQLLWVNLIMDALASLALATEPPIEKLLEKPPVNRSKSMITSRMIANIFGQSFYQVVVCLVFLFNPEILGVDEGNEIEEDGEISVHYTIIFNTFVWMTLFNEINCHCLNGEINVFKGILDNPMFMAIFAATAVLQVIIVQYSRSMFHVCKHGLRGKYWTISILVGLGSFPVQQVINMIYSFFEKKDEIKEKNNSQQPIPSTIQIKLMNGDVADNELNEPLLPGSVSSTDPSSFS